MEELVSHFGESRVDVVIRCGTLNVKKNLKNQIKSDLPTLQFRTMLPETHLSFFGVNRNLKPFKDGLILAGLHWCTMTTNVDYSPRHMKCTFMLG